MATDSSKPRIHLTVLSDNHTENPALTTEHGFSVFIECGDFRILFDTGAGTLFADNARKLNIHWWEADAVVLSHGHYDHTGGVAHALGGNSRAKWYLHPNALLPRYAIQTPEPPKKIGIPDPCRAALEGIPDRIIHTTRPVRISTALGVTGPIPRIHPGEDLSGPFFLREDRSIPDPILDDQAFLLRTNGGVIAIMGCTHSGVGNTLDYISSLCRERILAVVGGLHLQGSGAVRLGSAVDAFRRHGVRFIRPAHCTGEAATTVLKRNFPDAVEICRAGDVYEW